MDKNEDRFLRMSVVVVKTVRPRASIYRMVAAGSFPKQEKIGLRSVGWRMSEIIVWMGAPASIDANKNDWRSFSKRSLLARDRGHLPIKRPVPKNQSHALFALTSTSKTLRNPRVFVFSDGCDPAQEKPWQKSWQNF